MTFASATTVPKPALAISMAFDYNHDGHPMPRPLHRKARTPPPTKHGRSGRTAGRGHLPRLGQALIAAFGASSHLAPPSAVPSATRRLASPLGPAYAEAPNTIATP